MKAIPSVDPSFRYVWLIWASAFLLPWTALFLAWPRLRRPMLWASALTAPFGLTEFLFVPAYWNPPSLFDLAHRTGFDIESLILCFAIGGLATAGYRVLAPASEHVLALQVRNSHLHRWHRAALVSPFFVFAALLTLSWNPIYPGIAALLVGALASGLCRPDLWRNMLVGGVVFLALYAVFLLGLKALWPGYIEAVWNLGHLIAWRPAGLPLEELLFGFGFGMYWSSVYEHVAWRERVASPNHHCQREVCKMTDVLYDSADAPDRGVSVGNSGSVKLISLYRKRAKRYDRSALLLYFAGFRHWAYRERAIQSLALNRGDTVVDLGCGTGLNFSLLQEQVGPRGKIIGVDLTDAMLDAASVRVAAHGWSNVELVKSDAATYVFPPRVDGILSTFALTLVPEFDEVIRNGASALLLGKRFVILDFKRPSGWFMDNAAPLLAKLLTGPFGGTIEMASRKPWQSLEKHLALIQLTNLYLGGAYIAAGEKARFSGC